ncbi:hypothetical protein T484DRAFT_1757257 [Baffinella frigidus]|nr:hypothetical protein T484DRAFT_1757257 [Cryptophyta sp. CCMP2293]
MVHSAPKVAPPVRELTRRQKSMVNNEKVRQEVVARKVAYAAQCKERDELFAARAKAYREKCAERNAEDRLAEAKEKERIADAKAKTAAFETLVRNAPFTRPELGERSPPVGCDTPSSYDSE